MIHRSIFLEEDKFLKGLFNRLEIDVETLQILTKENFPIPDCFTNIPLLLTYSLTFLLTYLHGAGDSISGYSYMRSNHKNT